MNRSTRAPDRRRGLTVVTVLSALWALSISTAGAQVRAPEEGGFTRSLGQPGLWDFHVGAGVGGVFSKRTPDRLVTTAHVGVYRDLLDLPLNLVGLEADAYAGARGTDFDWGARGQLMSPLLRFGVGADYNGRDDRVDLLLTLKHPVRRGGLFGFGSTLRVDYLPGRDHSFSVAFELPVGRTMPMGRTRPRRDAVALEDPGLAPVPLEDVSNVAEVEEALSHVDEAAHWIHRLAVPYLEQAGTSDGAPPERVVEDLRALEAHVGETGPLYPRGRSLSEEVRTYHAELDRAFSIAVSGEFVAPGECSPVGRAVSRRAKEVLLHEVLLPYNRLLGQRKDEDTILEFGALARGTFVRWLHTESCVPAPMVDRALAVFTRLLTVIEGHRRDIHGTWGDSRLVWLPLQYALTPEQHDSQAELDALVARAVGQEFTGGNRIAYIINEQFDYQLQRMIHAAEDYHVLWIHDFPGYDEDGNPDAVSYSQVLDSYLAALVEKVTAYDRTGTLPVYMIFIDEWFYALRSGRLWMDLLEDPMYHHLDLPDGFGEWEGSIARAQAELRRAVSESRLLQAEAAQYGEEWLRNRIKVHVSITNRADPSFWTPEVLPFVGLPDNVMRDHRKVAFHDITEADPHRGRAMYTGMGVGSQYTSLNWEDRAIMLEGPAALGLKDAARELLLSQGIPAEEIPYHLHPGPRSTASGTLGPAATGWADDARVLELHNQTGYATKRINVAKAVLYSLMPPGSVIKTPDSLWNNGFWGGVLLGSALRGARVLVIAPAERNAPSWGFGQMARTKELLARLVAAQQILGPAMESSGGFLKTGLYSPRRPVTDVRGKLGDFMRTYREEDFIRDLFPLHPTIFPTLEAVFEDLGGEGATSSTPGPASPVAPPAESDPETSGDGETPKLHLKANFLASADAWNGLMSRPELGTFFQIWMENRVAQLRDRELAIRFPGRTPERLLGAAMPTLRSWEQELSLAEREHLVFYLLVGSANQNYRTMVMDGEVSVLLSGWSSILGVIDFISITGQSVWVDDLEELERLLPEYGSLRRWLGQWGKLLL